MGAPIPATEKSSFPAVASAETRLLILGSLPGEVSLSRNQYYGHPRNQFWRLMERVIGSELERLPYAERLAMLLRSGVGLWDVIETAYRIGSLDGAIRGHRANMLGAFVQSLPSLRAIAFNGAKASEIGRKQLDRQGGPALVTMPSSSPAYAIPFERKAAAWMQLRAFLDQSR